MFIRISTPFWPVPLLVKRTHDWFNINATVIISTLQICILVSNVQHPSDLMVKDTNKTLMNGYVNKIVEGEILSVSKDHSAATYLKVISLQSLSALLPPRALSLLKLLIHERSTRVSCWVFCLFVYFECKFASCGPPSLVLLCQLWTLDTNFLTVRLADACMIAHSWPFLVHSVREALFLNLYPADIWVKRSGCRPVHP